MVCVASYLNNLAFELVADPTQITMQLCLYRRIYQRLPVFGTEYKVQVVLYE